MRCTPLFLALTCLCTATAPQELARSGASGTFGHARPSRVAGPVNTGIPVTTSQTILVEGTLAAFFHDVRHTVHVFDLERGTAADTGIRPADSFGWPYDFRLHDGLVFAKVSEGTLGDRNGDGDALDIVVAVYEVASGEVGYLSSVPNYFFLFGPSWSLWTAGDVVAFETSEETQGGIDRNGDGDANDVVIETLLLRERNGLRSLGGATGGTIPRQLVASALPSTGCCVGPIGLPVASIFRVDAERIFVAIDERSLGAGIDLNADGDTSDRVLHVLRTDRRQSLNLGVALNFYSSLALLGDFACAIVNEVGQGVDLNGDGDVSDGVAHHWHKQTGALVNTMVAVESQDFVAGHWVLYRSEQEASQDFNGNGVIGSIVPHVYDPETGTLVNLGLVPRRITGHGTTLLLSVDESPQGADLNGDGDVYDSVLHRHDLVSGSTQNLTTALSITGPMEQGDRLVALRVSENDQGSDFNFDGDAADVVLGIFDGLTGTFRNAAMAVSGVVTSGPVMAFRATEAGQGGTDLNGDGDAVDHILMLYDADTQLTTSTGLAMGFYGLFGSLSAISSDLLFFTVKEVEVGLDLDGDGMLSHDVAHFLDLRTF